MSRRPARPLARPLTRPLTRPRLRTASLAALAAALLAGTAQLAGSPATAAPAASINAAEPGGDLWDPVSRVAAPASDAEPRVEPEEYEAFDLDAAALTDVLADAPLEAGAEAGARQRAQQARGAAAGGVRLSVPAPDGTLVAFDVVESPVMEPGLAAAHPEIRTYAGRGVDDPTASIRLDVTPAGFHASVRGPGGATAAWYVDPAYLGDDAAEGPYLSYRGTDLPADQRSLVEPPEAAELHEGHEEQVRRARVSAAQAAGQPVQRRTYRLALVTDPSYARYFGPENVLAEKATLMNRVNQIYNDDLAIRMLLIDETERLSFETDEQATGRGGPCGPNPCYTEAQVTQGCTSSLLNANRVALGQLVGADAYDIGHIALGINGGGIAGLGVVGGSGKGAGCTGLPQPEGDFMAIDYVAHEMGHQFGAPHTFNGTQGACAGGNRSGRSSVEPGSGSSVMAYAGICVQDDLQPHTDPYFSQRSITDITGTVAAGRTRIDEVQQVSLAGLRRGDSFRLAYDGRRSRPVTRGENYNARGVTKVLDRLLRPSTVRVTAYGSNRATTLTPAGFQVRFDGGPLRRTDVDLLRVVRPSAGVRSLVASTDRGGRQTNGGDEVEATGNTSPEVEAPEARTIPAQTPFTLVGGGSDADGDALVYTWEQDDRGGAAGTGLVEQTRTDGPLFRQFGAYAPVTPAGTLEYGSPGENQATGDPSRTFPDMDQVLAGNTNAATGTCPAPPAPPTSGGSNVPIELRECFAEWLPTPDYVGDPAAGNTEPSLHFRLTARDVDPEAGGTAFGDVTLGLDTSAGPFLVSSLNRTGAAVVAGRTQEVLWSVAGTRRLAEDVRITLSTDGGQTYPTVLAEQVPNNGAAVVTWPETLTEQGRIRIEAVDNYFFDVSDTDLTIREPDPR